MVAYFNDITNAKKIQPLLLLGTFPPGVFLGLRRRLLGEVSVWQSLSFGRRVLGEGCSVRRSWSGCLAGFLVLPLGLWDSRKS